MSLCESFRTEAGRVWRQMAESRLLGLSLSEETITETALYGIARRHQSGDIAIIPATKPAEARHGADWEWWFARGNQGIGFRVQAKRLFSRGQYSSLFKTGNRFGQLDRLAAQARLANCIPLYCFYNFDHPLGDFGSFRNACSHRYHAPTYWGCGLALPRDIKLINCDRLDTLRPAMVPWHYLVCGGSGGANLPTNAIAAVQSMAGRGAVLFGAHGDPEDAMTMAALAPLPEYVCRLIEIGANPGAFPAAEGPESGGDETDYLDHVYWRDGVVPEGNVGGIIVFDDRREL